MAIRKDLLEAMRPFAGNLAQSGFSRTVKKYLDNLRLQGAEIIRDVSLYKEYSIPAAQKLKLLVVPDGGPYCRHLDSEEEIRSFDSTCRKLHRFLDL